MSHQAGIQLEDFISEIFFILDESGKYGSSWVRSCIKSDLSNKPYSHYTVINDNDFLTIINIFELYRNDIEEYLLIYDEEEDGSWRDFKYYVILPLLPEESIDIANKILAKYRD